MAISFYGFAERFAVNPTFRVTVLLILVTILVNGWTDAPNAITTVVASGGMKLKAAVRMAAVCNFAGMLIMTTFHAKVLSTIYHLVDFGGNPANGVIALCAAMTAIILWAVSAWWFGIPTSESHALIAGISGAALAIHQNLSAVNGKEWGKVLCGLVFSVACGFLFGWIGGKGITHMRRIRERKRSQRGICRATKKKQQERIAEAVEKKRRKYMIWAQAGGAGAVAFMHGAQDGQKFIGVLILGSCLAEGKMADAVAIGEMAIPFWMLILCSTVMAMGTAVGGERIIATVGKEMVNLKGVQGIVADVAGAGCLLLASLLGIPVSTTHVKTTVVMGVGMAEDREQVNTNIVKELLLTWVITFPCCGAVGYLAARIFLLAK